MAVSLDHPAVAEYLRRLDQAAARLPAGRRGELIEEIRGHVSEALAAIGEDEAAVRGVLDRLGSPEEIVAAEDVGAGGADPTGLHDHGEVGGAPPMYVASAPGPYAESASSPAVVPPPISSTTARTWGPLERVAVLGLTLGTFALPLVGPLIGLICAWASDRWSRREKVVATIWTVLAPLVVVLAGLSVFVVRAGSTTVEQAPVIVNEAPAEPGPGGSEGVTP